MYAGDIYLYVYREVLTCLYSDILSRENVKVYVSMFMCNTAYCHLYTINT